MFNVCAKLHIQEYTFTRRVNAKAKSVPTMVADLKKSKISFEKHNIALVGITYKININ